MKKPPPERTGEGRTNHKERLTMTTVSTPENNLPQPTPSIDKAGKHAGDSTYLERWAKRYPTLQSKIEHARLKLGLAKHRAHRDLLQDAA